MALMLCPHIWSIVCWLTYGKSASSRAAVMQYCTSVPKAIRKPWMNLHRGYTSLFFPAWVTFEDGRLAAAPMS